MIRVKTYLLLVGCLLGVGLVVGLLAAPHQARAAGLLCLPPTPLTPIVNNLTGDVTLWWQPQMAVTSYTIEVYAANSLTPIKTYTVDGKTTTLVIPAADLACGNYQYRVKPECCDERCDKCQSQFNPKLDYCANMANLWNTPCGCTDVDYPTGVQYSFHFLCSDNSYAGWVCRDGRLPKGGVCEDGLPPDYIANCPLDQKIMGCNWECSPTYAYIPKACGSDYEVACGQGPNKQLVSGAPSYNLCWIKDPTGWTFNDNYLLQPPGVTEEQPPLLYKWRCGAGLKISDQCLACRRAECGAPHGKLYQGALPTDQLCLDANGQLTGELKNLTETDAGWTWDCVGRTECNTDTQTNQNWVKDQTSNAWQQVDKCAAAKISCGDANGQFYTKDNFETKSSGQDFLCGGQGKARGVFTSGKSYDELLLTEEKDSSRVIVHSMLWKCVGNEGTPEQTEIRCEAHIVGCRSEVAEHNFTAGSFASLLNVVPAPANLCYNGLNDRANNSQVTLDGPNDRLTPPGWTWTCSDTHGGLEKCAANLVACQKPPHEGEYKDKEELLSHQPLCTAGEVSPLFDVLSGAVPTGWSWWCQDDIGGKEICQANLLKCLEPPSGGVYDSWDDMAAKTGAKCTGTTATRTCTNVCSNKNLSVKVALADGKWSWICGSDACSAQELACQEPPDKGAYADWEELAAAGASCSGAGDVRDCQGVCNDKEKTVAVTFVPSANQFTWTCGAKQCESQKMGCGNFTAQLHPFSEIQQYQPPNDPHGGIDKEAICLGTGQPVWYSAHQGDGFTPWGLGEWSSNNPFVDHDASDGRYKEGTWLWQCKYGEKILPATGATGNVYKNEKDGQTYCYVWDKGVCGDVLDDKPENNNKFTFNEINAMAGDAQVRGNKSAPPLCARGIVFYDVNGLGDTNGNPLLEKRWHCEAGSVGSSLPQDHCGYWCEDGMLKGKQPCDNIDVVACAIPPYGKDYVSDTAFNDIYQDGAGGCEKRANGDIVTATNLVFNGNTCQWTWECDDNGQFGCFASKAGKFSVDSIVGPDSVCSTEAKPYTIAVHDCDRPTIQWSLTKSGLPININCNGASCDLPTDLERGNYVLRAEVTCGDDCMDTTPIVKTKNIEVKVSAPQNASLTANKTEICTGQDVVFTATADSQCQNPQYYWNGSSTPGTNTYTKNYPDRGDYEGDVSVLITCDNCYQDYSKTSPKVTVNDFEDPTSVIIKPADLEMCEDDPEPQLFTAEPQYANDDPNIPNCLNVKYVWRVDGFVRFGSTSTIDISTLVPPLAAGNHTISVTAQCQEECSDKTTTAEAFSMIIVKPKPTVTQGTITANPNPVCSQFDSILTLSDASCTGDYTPTIQWYEKEQPDGNEQPVGTGDTTLTINKEVAVDTDFAYYAKVTCGEDPCSDTKLTPVETVTVKPATTQSVSVNIPPLEFCKSSSQSIIVTANTECEDYILSATLTNNDTGDTDTQTVDNQATVFWNTNILDPGNYRVAYTLNCIDDSCVTPKVVTGNSDNFEVYDCKCGNADNKNFVDNNNDQRIDNLGGFQYCNGKCTPVLNPPVFDAATKIWNWHCQCGSLTGPDCSANKTECGPASTEGAGMPRIYTEASWDSPAKGANCFNGTLSSLTTTANYEPQGSNSCNNNGIESGWQWRCLDSVGSPTNQCTAERLDCGIADANRVLVNNCKIQPYDTIDGYRGSYQNNPPGTAELSHLCTITSLAMGLTDTSRGKWHWECGVDSLGDIKKCEARKDCGWFTRSGTDADQRDYATVDYNAAGCWTAEDVGTWTDAGATQMNWGQAARIQNVAGDGACYPTDNCSDLSSRCWWNPPVNSYTKIRHSFAALRNDICNKAGVCGTDSSFTLPRDEDWHKLESQLAADPTNNCSATRFNSDGCYPAGNGNVPSGANGYENDGLQDQITFNGAAGDGYWTNSQKFSPLDINFCPGGVCTRTLPYYEIAVSGQTSRAADAGNNTCTAANCTQHGVRCYLPLDAQAPSRDGGGQ